MRGRRWTVAAVAAAVVAGGAGTAVVVRDTGPDRQVAADPAGASRPRLSVEVVQLRRDVVLRRVAMAVTNRDSAELTIDSVQLSVKGFDGPGALPKGEPLPPGQTVNLPTPYGEPRCTGNEKAGAGRPEVRLVVRKGDEPAVEVDVTPTDPYRLLDRILAGECLARRLAESIEVRFGPSWEPTGSGDDVRQRGTLELELQDPEASFRVTQLVGNVLYALDPARPDAQPLADLDADHPHASLPVVVSAARCDGHARGEIKQPYLFRVWLAPAEGREVPVLVSVVDADRAALRQVCPF